MNYVLLFLVMVIVVISSLDLLIFLLPFKRKYLISRNRLRAYVLMILILALFASTYLPVHLFDFENGDVAVIHIQNGSTGETYEIEDPRFISELAKNLNAIKFKKRTSSLFRMGYGHSLSFVDDEGKLIEKLIINSESVIRYKGYFYKALNQEINQDLLEGNLY